MNTLVGRLGVAAEQIRRIRRITLGCLKSAVGWLPVGSNGNVESCEEAHDAWPIKVIWHRPNKQQKFEGLLFGNCSIRLLDGRGPFAPSRACKVLVGGETNGLLAWKYWQEGEKQGVGEWLPIKELEQAGNFD